MSSLRSRPHRRERGARGMTLLEVIIALSVMTMLTAGVLGTFIQARRLNKASIAQNCAVTIVQGYIEQLKNLPIQEFINAADTQLIPQINVSYDLHTMKDQTSTNVPLWTTPSSVAASTMLNAAAGTTPTSVVDNLQSFDLDSRANAPTTTWAAVWPGANTTLVPYPSANPGTTDLKMNFWVQITDLTPNVAPLAKAYEILLVYTYQYPDGNNIKWGKSSVRTVRSVVQTF